MRAAALGVAVLVAACGAPAAPGAPAGPDPLADDPVAALAGLEARLTSARRVVIEAEVTATGAIEVEARGTITVERERGTAVEVRGRFIDADLERRWTSQAPADPAARDVPPATWADGLLIGATRMGVLHNWAKLFASQDPDTGHGDVRTWVEVTDVAWQDGDPASRALTFGIVVAGVPSGEATLELDARGLPARRAQTVRFGDAPDEVMHVIERYLQVVVE